MAQSHKNSSLHGKMMIEYKTILKVDKFFKIPRHVNDWIITTKSH
jgi:hypothetical protein